MFVFMLQRVSSLSPSRWRTRFARSAEHLRPESLQPSVNMAIVLAPDLPAAKHCAVQASGTPAPVTGGGFLLPGTSCAHANASTARARQPLQTCSAKPSFEIPLKPTSHNRAVNGCRSLRYLNECG
jgi:hypothetical protein